MGKLANESLKKLLNCVRRDQRVIIPPLPGFDSGVHTINDREYLVVSTDPCLGVPKKWLGWLLIHYAASDVALFGADPQFCTLNLLGPPETSPQTFVRVMKQACRAAAEIGIAIVTGHTGRYEGLSTLIGVCTAYGAIEKRDLITPGDAKADDCILCVKPLGLETVVNFAMTQELALRLFGADRVRELSKLVSMQSCVKEASLLAKTGGVHAMHDATEGGLVAALNELADASKVGFGIDSVVIPFPRETYVLKKYFGLTRRQMLSMSSTGTILVAVDPAKKSHVLKILQKNGVQAEVLGFFTRDMQRVLMSDGRQEEFPRKAEDPYQKILSAKA